MQNNFENIDDVIAKFLAGEADADETSVLNEWRQQSPANALYFATSKKIFDNIAGLNTGHPVNVDIAWDKLNAKIKPGAKIISLSRTGKVIGIAASILLFVAFGLTMNWLFSNNEVAPLLLKADNTRIEQELPDGSKVFINKHSQLSFVENNNGTRTVKLKGEAFFEVRHDDKKPFVIEVSGLLVKDIGTAFNVKENYADNTVEVSVESGEVQLYTSDNSGLTLLKGDKGIYNRQTNLFTKSVVNATENSGSYRSKVFEFSEARLADVVLQLNDVYGCDIRLAEPAMENDHLSVVFDNESLDMIINIITETLDLEAVKKGDTILLSRKNGSS